MILDVYGHTRNIDYLETNASNFHSVTPWPNARKCVESRSVGSRSDCGITVNVDQLYLGARDAQTGRVHDLPGDGRGFKLRQGRVRSERGQQQEETGFVHKPGGRTDHQFVFLYKRMRADRSFLPKRNA